MVDLSAAEPSIDHELRSLIHDLETGEWVARCECGGFESEHRDPDRNQAINMLLGHVEEQAYIRGKRYVANEMKRVLVEHSGVPMADLYY